MMGSSSFFGQLQIIINIWLWTPANKKEEIVIYDFLRLYHKKAVIDFLKIFI